MKEKIGCVLDSDENYAVRLSEHINSGHTFMYKFMAFTSKDALLDCGERYEIELLVDGIGLKDEIIAEINPNSYVRLGQQDSPQTIKRYQPVDRIISDIVELLGVHSIGSGDEDVQLAMVYSPVGACGKTSLALALAEHFGRKYRTLYVNLEQFSGLSHELRGEKGLSEALFRFALGHDNYGKIMSCIDHIMDFDYLAPAVCADDISDCTDESLLELLEYIMQNGNYQRIVVDTDRVVKMPWKMLDAASMVVMPYFSEGMGRAKVMEFERYLLMGGREFLQGKIKKVTLPILRELKDSEIRLQSILASQLMEIARRCADE